MGDTPVALDFSRAIPLPPITQYPADAQALQSSVYYAAQQDPDLYARLLQLQQQTNLPPVVISGNEQQVQRQAAVHSINYAQFAANNPLTTGWASNRTNASVTGPRGIIHLGGMEQNGAAMQAATPTANSWSPTFWEQAGSTLRKVYKAVTGKSVDDTERDLYQYPLSRYAIDAVAGTSGLIGNIGSFFGWHGDGPTQANVLQRIDSGLKPENVFANDPIARNASYAHSNFLDWIARQAGPLVGAFYTGGASAAVGEGLELTAGLSELLGISEGAASRILGGMAAGGMFSADQGGQTYTQIAGAGGSSDQARQAANKVAAINLLPNSLFGFTDLVPALRDNSFLTTLLLGGITGASGQVAQNSVTGRPLTENVLASTLQSAAMMGAMHLGTSTFFGNLSQAIDATRESELRQRAPEMYQDAMQTLIKGNFHIPVQEFHDYFTGQSMDSAAVAAEPGATIDTDGEVVVPRANFFGKLDPEHQTGLMPSIIDPNSERTFSQYEAGGAQRWLDAMSQTDPETAATPEWQAVKEDLRRGYIGGGATPKLPTRWASPRNFWRNFGNSTNDAPVAR